MNAFKFTHDPSMPASGGFGAALKVILRDTGDLLGWVRRSPDGKSWHVYSLAGGAVSIADQRQTAASFLRHEFARANS